MTVQTTSSITTINELTQQSNNNSNINSPQSGATGSIFLGKAFRIFPSEPQFRDWKPQSNNLSNGDRTIHTGTGTNHATYPKNNHPFQPMHDPSCTKWSVVTTIFEPSEAVLRAAQVRQRLVPSDCCRFGDPHRLLGTGWIEPESVCALFIGRVPATNNNR